MDGSFLELANRLDQVAQRTSEAVKTPYDERIALAECSESLLQARANGNGP